jgi:hypothetical protein
MVLSRSLSIVSHFFPEALLFTSKNTLHLASIKIRQNCSVYLPHSKANSGDTISLSRQPTHQNPRKCCLVCPRRWGRSRPSNVRIPSVSGFSSLKCFTPLKGTQSLGATPGAVVSSCCQQLRRGLLHNTMLRGPMYNLRFYYTYNTIVQSAQCSALAQLHNTPPSSSP